jgi:protein subunit release factor B
MNVFGVSHELIIGFDAKAREAKQTNDAGDTGFRFQPNLCNLQIFYREANMILLPESDEDLLRECDVDTFRASGPGGQHVNKTESAVRLTHLPSGVVVTSQQERSQHRNKAVCLAKLREKIAKLNYRPARRVPTRLPRSAKNRTLEEKARRSRIKRLRSKPSPDE